MTLLEKQFHFSELLARFLWELRDLGYFVSMGECFRPLSQAEIDAQDGKGIVNSNHSIRLAVDLNLFLADPSQPDGYRLMGSVSDYQKAGERWKSYAALPDIIPCWGGDFITRPDADHFSLEHNGVK